MADEPSPAAEEPLEAFYGDDAEEARRLAETPEVDGTGSSEGGEARWRRPVAGALMAGIALGLRDVFQPEHHDKIAVEQPAPGQPTEPQRFEVHLDPDAPEASFAIYRPWVDADADADADADEPGDEGDEGVRAGSLGG